MKIDFSQIKMIANQVRNDQAVYKPEWQELLYYCSSAKTLYGESTGMVNTPAPTHQYKFDNTAQDACEDSANYLYQMCLGNIETGFYVELEENEKEINKIFKEYLKSEESRFQETARNYFNEARLLGNVGVGNFIAGGNTPYIDLFTMDTAAFQRANNSKIWMLVDDRSYPVYELIEQFGEDVLPELVRQRYNKDPLYRHNMKTVIYPNQDYKKDAIGKNSQQYKMIRFFEESEKPIDESELEYMPEFVSLNRTNREIYSRAPGSKVLNIIKALNRLVEQSMYGFVQLNNPTTLLMINNAFKDLHLRKTPGAIIPMKLPQSGQTGRLSQSLQEISDTGGTFQILKDYFSQLILHAWRVDEFFQAIQTNMTATQASLIDQRTKSFLIAEIEPHKIVWTNILKRLFRDCWKCGMFGEYQIDNETTKDVKIRWNNYMALREKQDVLVSINDFLTYSAALVERDPQLQSAIDSFNILLNVAEATGQKDKIATEDEYSAVQQNANQQAMQAAQLQGAQQAANIQKTMAETQKLI